ncbi:MBL fold metallo-hydrolase [Rhodobacteraceae bacterium KMM 6894]|nr:MBL fold metallo-hydrolase [Rhodobacteraceae bacterium KMM 6894]
MSNPIVKGFWDEPTGSWQYVFYDPDTMKGAIIDPVLDFDPLAGATSTKNAQRSLNYVRAAGIELVWVLDTHPHADHFSAAHWIKAQTGAPTAIGEKVTQVQTLWQDIYNLPDDFARDGSQWDHLFADGDELMVGNVPVRVMFSPGHPSEAEYRAVRDARDATLPLPKLMLAALQINIRGGRLPEPENNGRSYLNLPLNYFESR